MSTAIRSRRGRQAATAGLLTALSIVGLFAPTARATYDPLATGATKLTFAKAFIAALKQDGVKLSASGGARIRAGTVSFPVSGGKLDPADGKGTVEHAGILLFRRGRRLIPLRALTLKTTRGHAPLSVKVGGGQLKLAQTNELNVSRRGFGSEIRVDDLKLSAKVATRFGKKLGLRGAFRPGEPLGSSITEVRPSTVALAGKGRVSLDLAPGFAANLQSLFVAVNPIFPAEHPGPFAFPIFGGTLATDASVGRVATQGSLEFLQLGGGQVFWREPTVDFGAGSLNAEAEVDPSPPYGGKLGPVPIGGLTVGSVFANARTRLVSVMDVALALDPSMAATFNEVFARPQGREGVFAPGEAIGTLNFDGQAE